jgi:ATP-dependent RNA helicase DDX23/PRP28
MAEIAARAEARARIRMEQQMMKDKAQALVVTTPPAVTTTQSSDLAPSDVAPTVLPAAAAGELVRAKFLTKADRERLALERLAKQRSDAERAELEAKQLHDRFVTGEAAEARRREARRQAREAEEERERREREEKKAAREVDHEIQAIREQYLGGGEKKRKIFSMQDKFQKVFKFDWDADEDTARNDLNPLFINRVKINSLFGRGYIGGVDPKEQRQNSNFLVALSSKRVNESRGAGLAAGDMPSDRPIVAPPVLTDASFGAPGRRLAGARGDLGLHWSEKALADMTERDWRIFREDFDIRIQHGRATLPLRFWNEADFPSEIIRALADLGYEKPSPIQRQAIPIGMDCRDVIGIAETGSGKTAAFLIPLLCYMLKLPRHQVHRCAEEGPLAVVMAPTRELAMQIEEECIKLAKYTSFQTACIVGGQSIEEQSIKLRKGVHIIIGTPGRMVDCIENSFLVLNQCNYVVLDEADRMIDMGFETQVVAVLEAMGGLLKSEDEARAEAEIADAKSGGTMCRVTAMFSATMPPEVERIAKTFLRHPAIIKIGDQDSGKNKRIEQRVHFIAEAQKKNYLLQELRGMTSADKAIVFVNSKKQGDIIGKYLESSNYRCGILHGGRSQDQREETLEHFRNGDFQILVATDVAGRGLDIPDVTNVVNFDMPNKIANYCHRIGRTGRAGRSGVASTFITEEDTEVMFDLKQYLESTNSPIPAQLARHPAALAPKGARDAGGKLLGAKKDQIMYAK